MGFALRCPASLGGCEGDTASSHSRFAAINYCPSASSLGAPITTVLQLWKLRHAASKGPSFTLIHVDLCSGTKSHWTLPRADWLAGLQPYGICTQSSPPASRAKGRAGSEGEGTVSSLLYHPNTLKPIVHVAITSPSPGARLGRGYARQ